MGKYDKDLTDLHKTLLATLAAAAVASESEDDAREKVRVDIVASPAVEIARTVSATVKRIDLDAGADAMWEAYQASLADVADQFGPTADQATNFVAAAAVFVVVKDRDLDTRIADLLGVSYEEEGWPGPRYVPSWGRGL